MAMFQSSSLLCWLGTVTLVSGCSLLELESLSAGSNGGSVGNATSAASTNGNTGGSSPTSATSTQASTTQASTSAIVSSTSTQSGSAPCTDLPMVHNFDQPDGPIGNGFLSVGVATVSNRLVRTGAAAFGILVWNTRLGPEQEVSTKIDTVAADTRDVGIFLSKQLPSLNCELLDVYYNKPMGKLVAEACTDGIFKTLASQPITLNAGDVLCVHLDLQGLMTSYVNQVAVLVAQMPLDQYAFVKSGGYSGLLMLDGGTALDDYRAR